MRGEGEGPRRRPSGDWPNGIGVKNSVLARLLSLPPRTVWYAARLCGAARSSSGTSICGSGDTDGARAVERFVYLWNQTKQKKSVKSNSRPPFPHMLHDGVQYFADRDVLEHTSTTPTGIAGHITACRTCVYNANGDSASRSQVYALKDSRTQACCSSAPCWCLPAVPRG